METRRVGVFLQDGALAGQLVGYWGRKARQYRFLVFTEGAELGKELEEAPLYLLITDGESFRGWQETDAFELLCTRIGRSVFLIESEAEMREDVPCILRYQSADQILAEALGMREAAVKAGMGLAERRERVCLVETAEADVIGVYSPVGRCGKSRFALALGKAFGERCQALYLNLEVFSDLHEWLLIAGTGDVSDLLYYQEQGRLTGDVWNRLSYPLQGLAIVGPAMNPDDVAGLSAACCAELLHSAKAAGYQKIVLDIGSTHPDPAGILALCTRVYAPVTDEEVSRLKWRHFTRYLEKTGWADLMDRMETVQLPMASLRYETSGLPECGEELEAFVRRLSCLTN